MEQDFEMILNDVELPKGVVLYAWHGEDGALVIQVDTQVDTGHVRIYVNDGEVFDRDPEESEPHGATG